MASDLDYEREYRARTGKVFYRKDRCANNKRRGAEADCPGFARRASYYCSSDCLVTAAKRTRNRWVGGSLVGLCDETGDGTPPTRNPSGRP